MKACEGVWNTHLTRGEALTRYILMGYLITKGWPKPNIRVTRGNKDLTSSHAPGFLLVSPTPPERLRVSQH
jgi:hypothetical protein